jgi:hypothetical protein
MLIPKCEICGEEADEQPITMMDSRKDPDRNTNKPPPNRYAVAVIPYRVRNVGMNNLGASEK